MKRTIYIFILLLADIAVLAHTVIPHHHHHNKIFIASVNFFNNNSFDIASFPHCNCPYNDNEQNNVEDCPINEAIASTVFRMQEDDRIDFYAPYTNDYNSDLFTVSTDVCAISPDFLWSSPFILCPYFTGDYLNQISYSCGLRAPPAC